MQLNFLNWNFQKKLKVSFSEYNNWSGVLLLPIFYNRVLNKSRTPLKADSEIPTRYENPILWTKMWIGHLEYCAGQFIPNPNPHILFKVSSIRTRQFFPLDPQTDPDLKYFTSNMTWKNPGMNESWPTT